ncbi:DUF5007 domain-containing protein [Flavisolibacter sp. BT320]|nr:DUF5007 domain-containing protein [Flavisolibacter longurius]
MKKYTFQTTLPLKFLLAATVLLSVVVSCKKYLPEERETVGVDSQFTIDLLQPVLGRTTYFSNTFFKGSTTFPADFKIVNVRRRNGDAAPELTDVFPVKVWKEAYDGTETSLAEIEAKRQLQNRPLFEIGPHSGEFIMWGEARSSFVRSQPDSGYLFDVELSNSGGRRYFRNFRLMPMKERPFEPSNVNAISGQPLSNGVFPSQVTLIKGASKDRYLSFFDVDVFIRKQLDPTKSGSGNTLTFKFRDTLYKPMNPAQFSTTNWASLVHGFNMKMTDSSVTYDVAYPVPLVELPTKFTSPDGKRARVRFTYSRIGFGGSREDASFGLDFAIYEPGDWEIVFAFKNDNPKFIND